MTAFGIKIVAGLVAVVALIGAYWAWHHHVYNQGLEAGYDNAVKEIAAQDGSAVDAANKLKSKRQDCTAGGGTWDQSSGLCVGP